MKYYAVFDTNVLVASLLTQKTDTATAISLFREINSETACLDSKFWSRSLTNPYW